MKQRLAFLALSLALAVGLSACDNKTGKHDVSGGDKPAVGNPNALGVAVSIEHLDARDFGKWVYFSFRDQSVVDVKNPKTDLNWDVAFRREQFRVNGSLGFSGKAAVAMAGTDDFDAPISSEGKKFVGNVEAYIAFAFAHKAEWPYKVAKDFYVTNVADDFEHNPSEPGVAKGYYSNDYALYDIRLDHMMDGNADALYPPKKRILVFRAADGKTHYAFQMDRAVWGRGEGGYLTFHFQRIK